MSSILEALRELEGSKPSAQRSRVAWAGEATEERTPLRRAAEILGIVAFGLVLGGAAFAAFLWVGETSEPAPVASSAAKVPPPMPTGAPGTPAPGAAPTLAPAAPAPPAPAWLSRMGAPRGHVADTGEGRPAPVNEATAPRAAGLSLVRVRYGESRSERTATLRIDGSAVVLHEGETASGIELQLVTPSGAYVRRGAEVLMLEPSR